MEVLALASRSQLVVAIMRWPSVASLGILEVQASSVSPCVPVETRVGSEVTDGTLPFVVDAAGAVDVTGAVDVAGGVDVAGRVDAAGAVDAAGLVDDPVPSDFPLFISAQPKAKIVRPKEAHRNMLENGFIGLAPPQWINKSRNILETPEKNKVRRSKSS